MFTYIFICNKVHYIYIIFFWKRKTKQGGRKLKELFSENFWKYVLKAHINLSEEINQGQLTLKHILV